MFAAEVQCRFKFVIWLKDQEAPGDEEIEKKLLVHVELEIAAEISTSSGAFGSFSSVRNRRYLSSHC